MEGRLWSVGRHKQGDRKGREAVMISGRREYLLWVEVGWSAKGGKRTFEVIVSKVRFWPRAARRLLSEYAFRSDSAEPCIN